MDNRKVAELAQIRRRLEQRAKLDAADRTRQRELVREYVAAGHTWDETQDLAGISRTTLRITLQRRD